MFRIPIRSRFGNAVVGALGVAYLLSATVILIYYVITCWGAVGMTDRILQLALFGASVAGLIFIQVAADNLGVRWPRRGATQTSRMSRDHQTAAASGM
jgi:hypothetical protein